MALPSFGQIWELARKVEDLLELQKKTHESFQIVDARLKDLETWRIRSDAERDQLITEARSAATTAATMIGGSLMSDLVTRITRLEGRMEQLENGASGAAVVKRLPKRPAAKTNVLKPPKKR